MLRRGWRAHVVVACARRTLDGACQKKMAQWCDLLHTTSLHLFVRRRPRVERVRVLLLLDVVLDRVRRRRPRVERVRAFLLLDRVRRRERSFLYLLVLRAMSDGCLTYCAPRRYPCAFASFVRRRSSGVR